MIPQKNLAQFQSDKTRLKKKRKKANKNKLYSKETQTPSSFRHDKEVATMLESKKMMFKRDLELVLKQQVVEREEFLSQIAAVEAENDELRAML